MNDREKVINEMRKIKLTEKFQSALSSQIEPENEKRKNLIRIPQKGIKMCPISFG